MRLYNMIGYKLYKEKEDGSIHMIRIVGMHKPFKIKDETKDPSEINILDYDDNTVKKVRVDTLKEYSPLKPDGIFTASIVTVKAENDKVLKDVIISGSKYVNVELGLSTVPYCACRQSITDIFYNLFAKDENDTLVGLSINQDTCPSNFDYRNVFMCNNIVYNDYINFYRTDTLEDILTMVKVSKFDEVLKDLYTAHVNAVNNPSLFFKNEHGGWCRDLNTLLKQNNFQSDINQMLGISDVGFVIADFLEEKLLPGKEDEGLTYNVARDDLRYWLSSIYKVNINEANFLEYDHDINLADFNNSKYLLLRDITNKLYLVVYTEAGEYFEADLEAKAAEMDFTTKFKIDYYNKYNRSNK